MTAADQHQAAQAALHGADAETLRRQLPDLADGLHAALLALFIVPSESGAADLSRSLYAASRHLLRLQAAIGREVATHD